MILLSRAIHPLLANITTEVQCAHIVHGACFEHIYSHCLNSDFLICIFKWREGATSVRDLRQTILRTSFSQDKPSSWSLSWRPWGQMREAFDPIELPAGMPQRGMLSLCSAPLQLKIAWLVRNSNWKVKKESSNSLTIGKPCELKPSPFELKGDGPQ